MKSKKHKPPEEFSEPIPVEDLLDLHGFFPNQIPEVVNEFLAHTKEQGYREVRIAHGKGKSRLKWEVHQILENHQLVEAFGDAPPERGGWGSTIVTLK